MGFFTALLSLPNWNILSQIFCNIWFFGQYYFLLYIWILIIIIFVKEFSVFLTFILCCLVSGCSASHGMHTQCFLLCLASMMVFVIFLLVFCCRSLHAKLTYAQVLYLLFLLIKRRRYFYHYNCFFFTNDNLWLFQFLKYFNKLFWLKKFTLATSFLSYFSTFYSQLYKQIII